MQKLPRPSTITPTLLLERSALCGRVHSVLDRHLPVSLSSVNMCIYLFIFKLQEFRVSMSPIKTLRNAEVNISSHIV